MPILKKSAPKKAKRMRMHEEMHKFGEGKLHSGSKKGPVVSNPKQAVAIALHESGQSKKKSHKSKSKSMARCYGESINARNKKSKKY